MAPGTLPMPPRMMMAKTLRFMISPMAGVTDTMGAISAAPMAASAPEMAKVSMPTWAVLMPTSRAPSRFWLIASMVAPVRVRRRKKFSPSMASTLAASTISRCQVIVTPPRLRMPGTGSATCLKSAPHTSCTPASRKNSTPSAAIMGCTCGASRSGKKISRSISAASSATQTAESSSAGT